MLFDHKLVITLNIFYLVTIFLIFNWTITKYFQLGVNGIIYFLYNFKMLEKHCNSNHFLRQLYICPIHKIIQII